MATVRIAKTGETRAAVPVRYRRPKGIRTHPNPSGQTKLKAKRPKPMTSRPLPWVRGVAQLTCVVAHPPPFRATLGVLSALAHGGLALVVLAKAEIGLGHHATRFGVPVPRPTIRAFILCVWSWFPMVFEELPMRALPSGSGTGPGDLWGGAGLGPIPSGRTGGLQTTSRFPLLG